MVWGIEWENAKEEQRTEQWKRFGQWGQNADSSSLVQTEWQTKRHRAERGESFTEEKMKMKGLSIFLLFCSIKAIPLKTGHHHRAETLKVGKSAFYQNLLIDMHLQTWNLSKNLHDPIFGQKNFTHCKRSGSGWISGKYGLRNQFWPLESGLLMRLSWPDLRFTFLESIYNLR